MGLQVDQSMDDWVRRQNKRTQLQSRLAQRFPASQIAVADSLTPSAGTADQLENGKVHVVGAGAVVLTNIFDDDAENYVLRWTGASGDYLAIRFVVGTTVETALLNTWQAGGWQNAAVFGSVGHTGTLTNYLRLAAATGTGGAGKAEIMGPHEPRQTRVNIKAGWNGNTTLHGFGELNNTTQYDGLQIITLTNTIIDMYFWLERLSS